MKDVEWSRRKILAALVSKRENQAYIEHTMTAENRKTGPNANFESYDSKIQPGARGQRESSHTTRRLARARKRKRPVRGQRIESCDSTRSYIETWYVCCVAPLERLYMPRSPTLAIFPRVNAFDSHGIALLPFSLLVSPFLCTNSIKRFHHVGLAGKGQGACRQDGESTERGSWHRRSTCCCCFRGR